MELPESQLKGILSLRDERVLDGKMFNRFVELVFDILLEKKNESELRAISEVSQSHLKIVYSSLVSLILEHAKRNTDPLGVSEFLKLQKWPADRIEVFTQFYEKNLSSLRQALARTNFSFPHIVDVDWRLDYFIKKDTISKVNKPVYTIALKTKENGESKDITFACTLEQLQDLVTKLQDATHSINRIDVT